MRFIKKLILWLIILIAILIGILALTLKFIVTPERFKPVISEKIEAITGYHTSFNGPLSWGYLPNISVNASNIVLTSPNQDEATVKQLSFGVKLLPLLHASLEPTHIDIKNVSYRSGNGSSTELRNLSISAKPFKLDELFNLRISGEIIPGNGQQVNTINLSAATFIDSKKNSIGLDPMTIMFNHNIANGDFYFSHNNDKAPKPNATLPDSISFNGHLKADQWAFGSLRLNKLRIKFNAEDSVININPFLTDFYDGKAQGQARIDLQNKTPVFTLKANLVGTQLAKLLKDVTRKEYASGTIMAELDIKGKGLNTDEILNSLDGSIKGTINSGELKFADLNKTITTALTLINQKQLDKKTLSVFDSIKAEVNFDDGIADLQLNLLAPSYKATGKGEIDLLKQTINLLIKAYYTKSNKTKDVSIPINVSGAITNPKVSVDASSSLLNSVLSDGSKNLENIKSSLKNLFS